MKRPGRSPRPGRSHGAQGWRRLLRGIAPKAQGQGLVDATPDVPLRKLIRQFWPDVRPYRFGILVMLVVGIVVPGIETVEIWTFQRVIDQVLIPRNLHAIYAIAILYIALTIWGGLLGWISSYLSTWVGEHLQLRVRARMLDRLQRASTTVLDRMRAGDLLSRLNSDVNSVETLMIGIVVTAVGSIARLALFGAALARLDWRLALLSATVIPVFWLIAQRFARRLKRVAREKRRRAGSMTAVAEETLAAMALVQVHGRQAEEGERFNREARSVLAAELASARLRATFPLVVNLLELIGMLGVMTAGAWALQHNQMTVGGLLVFLTYLSQMYQPVKTLGDLGNNVVSSAAGVQRVAELLDVPLGVTEREDAIELDPSQTRGELELRGAGYAYPGGRRAVLADAHAIFAPGRLTVISGPSGSGKSTMIRLLARLDDPDTGAVLLDGRDVRDLKLRSLRDTVTVLLQEAPVLDASVRDNITFASPGADDDAVWEALRLAGIHQEISQLPDGLSTRLNQRGRALSGGQRQRIALARALMTGARVLILDEPTTGLDARAAARFLDTLRGLSADRTVIIATHDVSVLAAADSVIRLEPLSEGPPADPWLLARLEVAPDAAQGPAGGPRRIRSGA
jgi:ATP-binding cassette, subfamily B, bacterial